MKQSGLRQSITHQVRKFLDEQGVDLAPWSGLDETYFRLFSLLKTHRNDTAFWNSLEILLGSIVKDSTDKNRDNVLPAPTAELLSSWDVDSLVRDLRAALPQNSSETPKQFATRLSAPVLSCFLMIGVGINGGCASAPQSNKSTQPQTTQTATPIVVDTEEQVQECSLDRPGFVWSTLRESTISEHDKEQLCLCFEDMSQSWNDDLEELFASASPEEIAGHLENVLEKCINQGGLNGEYFDPEASELELLKPTPLYKGVTF